jgi:hypothetical protein
MSAALADQTERGDIPKGGRPAVAEYDLPAVWKFEQLTESFADIADEALDRRLAVAGAHD